MEFAVPSSENFSSSIQGLNEYLQASTADIDQKIGNVAKGVASKTSPGSLNVPEGKVYFYKGDQKIGEAAAGKIENIPAGTSLIKANGNFEYVGTLPSVLIATGNVDVNGTGEKAYSIEAGGDIKIRSGLGMGTGLLSGGSIDIKGNTKSSSIRAVKDVTIGGESGAYTDIVSGGSVTAKKTDGHNKIYAGKDINVTSGDLAATDVRAKGNVNVTKGNIGGAVSASIGGDVSVGGTIKGLVKSGGSVTAQSTAKETEYAPGARVQAVSNITIAGEAGGNLRAGGDIKVGSTTKDSTIVGQNVDIAHPSDNGIAIGVPSGGKITAKYNIASELKTFKDSCSKIGVIFESPGGGSTCSIPMAKPQQGAGIAPK